MSVNKKGNYKYDGLIPEMGGDIVRGQDLIRDHWYNQDRIGKVLLDLGETVPIIISGGVVTKGTGDTLNITVCVGYHKYQIEIPDSFASVPPTKMNADIDAIRVESTQQTNMAIASATLNGSAVNYVKLRYTETNGNTRQRSKKVGIYSYELIPSFQFVVDTVAPTAYEICLKSFVGTSGGAFTFGDVNKTQYLKYGIYDYVVDSQAKFDALVASSTWFNIKNVLFKTNVTRNGTLTVPTNIEKIHAINNATITFTNVTASQPCLTRASIIDDPNYEVIGLSITISTSVSIFGFNNFANIYNCEANITGASECTGFTNCKKLFNCKVNLSCTGTVYSINNIGFSDCTYLDSCVAIITTLTQGSAIGFLVCSILSNCFANVTASYNGYGFQSCIQIVSSEGVAVAETASGFQGCLYISCSNGAGTSNAGDTGSGFRNCSYLSSCTGVGLGNTGSLGYGYNVIISASACGKASASKTSTWGGTNSKIRGCVDTADIT